VNGRQKNKERVLVWQQLAGKFADFAREEQGREGFTTDGKELGVFPGLLRAYRNHTNCPESIASDAKIARWLKERTRLLRKMRKAIDHGKTLKTDLSPEPLEIAKSRLREAKAETARGLKAAVTARWELGDGINPDFKERVQLYIAEAGHALPDYPNGAKPEEFWLDQLWLYLRKNYPHLSYAVSNDVGMIHSVCVGSAKFCVSIGDKVFHNSVTNDRRVNAARRVKPIAAEFDRFAGRLMHEAHQKLIAEGARTSTHRKTPDLPFEIFIEIAAQVDREQSNGKPKFPLRDVLTKPLWGKIAEYNTRNGNSGKKLSTLAKAAQHAQFKSDIRQRFNRAETIFRTNVV